MWNPLKVRINEVKLFLKKRSLFICYLPFLKLFILGWHKLGKFLVKTQLRKSKNAPLVRISTHCAAQINHFSSLIGRKLLKVAFFTKYDLFLTKRSKYFSTSNNTASKYIPKRPRICIDWYSFLLDPNSLSKCEHCETRFT